MPERVDAAALARRVAALPEPAMRRQVLAETLAALDPRAGAALLAELLARGRAAGPPWEIALLALVRLLAEPERLAYPVAAAVYSAARASGHADVARLFFGALPVPPPARTPRAPAGRAPAGSAAAGPPPGPGGAGPAEADGPGAPAVAAGKVLAGRDGRPLTLGERKALARGHRRGVLERLLRDPDATVIRILLGNPHLTERDVVALAATRPVRGEVLAEVFASERWLARHAVKVALASNPYAPTDLALRLLAFLRRRELKAIAIDGTIAAPVRVAAAELAERR